MPYEYSSCLAGIGCATDGGFPLSCQTITEETDGGMVSQNLCVQTCTTSAGCNDAYAACVGPTSGSGFCYLNFCASSAAAYSACNAQGTGDGQCIPEVGADSTTFNLCFQTGSVATYGTCGSSRGSPLCSNDNICLGPILSNGDLVCFSICDTGAAAGAPTCASPATCQGVETGTTLGACLTTCTTTTATCPATTSCDTSIELCVP